MPAEDSRWDPNTEEGLRLLRRYREALLKGLLTGSQKATNISKVEDFTKKGLKFS